MKTLYIGQDSILEHLNLSFGEFKRLLLTFDIRTILDKYTKNQFLLFREYLVKSGHTVGEMDESCFFEDIVIEKRQSLEELIRSRKKNHTPQYPADTKLLRPQMKQMNLKLSKKKILMLLSCLMMR